MIKNVKYCNCTLKYAKPGNQHLTVIRKTNMNVENPQLEKFKVFPNIIHASDAQLLSNFHMS